MRGHGLTFTSGRGTEVCVAAIRALEPLVVGRTLEAITGGHARLLAQPHLGYAAALARAREGRDPSRDRRRRQCRLGSLGQARGQAALEAALGHGARAARRMRRLPLHRGCPRARGGDRAPAATRAGSCGSASARSSPRAIPAYTTSAGWLGYGRRQGRVARAARPCAAGFTHVKMKVGADLEADDRRAALIRRGARPRRHADDGCEPGLGRRRGDRVDAAARAPRPVVDRGADEPRRRARSRAHPPRGRSDPRRDRRARPEPRDLQAAVPGRGDRRLPDRRLPHRRRQRGDRRAPAGGEVRRPRLPARRRRRPLRVRAAPRLLRLHRGQRLARAPGRRVGRITCTSTSASPRSWREAATSHRWRPATASRCCPPRSTSTSSRTARPGRRSRARWAADDAWHRGREQPRAGRAGLLGLDRYRLLQGAAAVAPGRSRADPACC